MKRYSEEELAVRLDPDRFRDYCGECDSSEGGTYLYCPACGPYTLGDDPEWDQE